MHLATGVFCAVKLCTPLPSICQRWELQQMHKSISPSTHPTIHPSSHLFYRDRISSVAIHRLGYPMGEWSNSSTFVKQSYIDFSTPPAQHCQHGGSWIFRASCVTWQERQIAKHQLNLHASIWPSSCQKFRQKFLVETSSDFYLRNNSLTPVWNHWPFDTLSSVLLLLILLLNPHPPLPRSLFSFFFCFSCFFTIRQLSVTSVWRTRLRSEQLSTYAESH